MAAKMRILLISEFFPASEAVEVRGGVELRAYQIGRELAKRHAVTVLTSLERGQPRESIIAGMRVIRCGMQRAYGQVGALIQRFSFMRQAIKVGIGLKPDIVDGYSWVAYFAAHKIGRKTGAPAVLTYHDVWLGRWINLFGLAGFLGEIAERAVLRKRWSKIIAVSNYTKANLIRAGIQASAIEVVHNGIDLDEIGAIKAEKSASPTLCCIARLVSYKRVGDLIRALAIARRQIPGIRAKIIGTGPEEAGLRKLVGQLGLSRAIDFLGFVPSHAEVLKVLKASHLFCLPSVVEGFGIGVVEAMAAGVPYVAARIKPIAETTGNGVGGLFHRPTDVAALAAAIKKLLSDRALYTRKAREGRAFARRYDWGVLAKRVEKVYRGIVKERSA